RRSSSPASGLIGATLAPAAVGLQNGRLSSAGTAFAAIVFAGTAIVALGRRWQALLAIGVAATLPQVAVLVGQSEPREWSVVGVADLLSGPTLAIAWAAEAAVLAWLARRIDEPRYQLASLAYLAAAVVHALALDAPLRRLYEAGEHPARGGLAFVGVALAGSI